MTPYEAGRQAAERGCYRILMCPKDSNEEKEWLRGYDEAKAEGRFGEKSIEHNQQLMRDVLP